MTKSAHQWVRERLAARRAGLLNDDEERRIAEHLASCETCGPAWQAELADGEDEPARRSTDTHVPAGVLATWPRASQNLRGFERAMVREHLERCETCRQDLEMLGYAPVLEIVPALEWAKAEDPAPARVPVLVVPEQASNVIRVFKPAPRKTDWARWAFGGWAAVASAAAVLLFANPSWLDRGGEEVRPPTLPTGPPPPAAWTLNRVGPVLRLRSGVRGEGSAPLEHMLAADTRAIPISIEPLDLQDTSRVEITIAREGEEPLLRVSVTNGELGMGQFLLDVGQGGIRPGIYVVRVKGGPDRESILPKPEEAEYRFALKRSDSAGRP